MTITLTREEVQQVLDALDEYRDSTEDFRVANRCISLIKTLRARLAQPEPEPVAWLNKTKHGTWSADALKCEGDEPSEPLYTAPPQRKEWQGLTDEEMFDCLAQTDGEAKRLPLGFKWFAEAIEAKLKEKNA